MAVTVQWVFLERILWRKLGGHQTDGHFSGWRRVRRRSTCCGYERDGAVGGGTEDGGRGEGTRGWMGEEWKMIGERGKGLRRRQESPGRS